MATPLAAFVPQAPFARGEDVVVDLTGPTSASGWTLEVTCAYAPTGPTITATGVTVAWVGGATNVIRLTFPKAFTEGLTLVPNTGGGQLFVEVWRTDSGNYRLLRRLSFPFFDPVAR